MTGVEWPTRLGDLSAYALDEAVKAVGTFVERSGESPERDNAIRAMATIRLVARMPRSAPWYGEIIDPSDSSVHVGIMMRNAFEALGEDIDEIAEKGLISRPKNWFTRFYLPRWLEGRRRYYDFLEHLFDAPRWEAEYERRRLSDEQAARERALLAYAVRERAR